MAFASHAITQHKTARAGASRGNASIYKMRLSTGQQCPARDTSRDWRANLPGLGNQGSQKQHQPAEQLYDSNLPPGTRTGASEAPRHSEE
jgi:hypothetical protein